MLTQLSQSVWKLSVEFEMYIILTGDLDALVLLQFHIGMFKPHKSLNIMKVFSTVQFKEMCEEIIM